MSQLEVQDSKSHTVRHDADTGSATGSPLSESLELGRPRPVGAGRMHRDGIKRSGRYKSNSVPVTRNFKFLVARDTDDLRAGRLDQVAAIEPEPGPRGGYDRDSE